MGFHLRPHLWLVAGLGLLQTLPIPTAADETARDGDGSATRFFTDSIDVNLVNLEVTVVDGDGQPITGLGREDFTVLEDGEPVALANFYAVERGRRITENTGEAPEEDETALVLPELEPGNTAARHVALVIDNTNLQRKNRNKTLDAFQIFIAERLTPADRIMVVTIDDDYHVRLPFSSEPEALSAALEEIGELPAEGSHQVAAQRAVIRDLEGFELMPGEGSITHLQMEKLRSFFEIEHRARQDFFRIRGTLEALRYLASSLAGLPGQKVVLYVSEGLAMRPGESLYHAHYNLYGEMENKILRLGTTLDKPELTALTHDLSRYFNQLVDHFQASDLTFYALDAAGQRAIGGHAVARPARSIDSVLARNAEPVWDSRLDLQHEQNVQSTLRLASRDTGGDLIVNNRKYDEFFDRMWNALDNYYSLGYVAPHPKEGKFHKLEVRVDRPGARVRHARGYSDKTWRQRLVDMTVSQLLVEAGDNPLGAQILPGEKRPAEGARGRQLVTIQVAVPLDALTLVPYQGRQVGRVLLVLMARDEAGDTSAPRLLRLEVDQESLEPDQEHAVADFELFMREGEQTLAIGVRDEISGVMSTTSTQLWLVPGVN